LTLTYTSLCIIEPTFKIIGILKDEVSMAYTVKKLSELSKVTVRTLHFYEEAGLLKPAFHGSNGYRYYEAKELLLLQQILVFKELGFTLKQIKKVLEKKDFDCLGALHSHKRALTREREKMKKLLKTIDKTIEHIKGETKMNDHEIFDGFNMWAKGKGSESYCIDHCVDLEKCKSRAEAIVLKSVIKQAEVKKEKSYYENLEKKYTLIYKKIAECIENGLTPDSKEVQLLIKEHVGFAGQFHKITREVYLAFAELYCEDERFKKQLKHFHPKLANFMVQAMKIFAEKALS
jgi:MerR family transcriptional regulator, thiopeptide resistance regulator